MKNNFLSPNSVTGFLSVILGFTIIYLLPTQLEKPVLIFGQSSAEIDPELFPSFVAILLIIFGLYTILFDRKSLTLNSWPQFTKEKLKNIFITILSLILFSIIFEKFGFVISSFLLIFFLGYYLGNVKIFPLSLISIIFPLSVFSLFVNIMHVFLPTFPYFEFRIGNFLIM